MITKRLSLSLPALLLVGVTLAACNGDKAGERTIISDADGIVEENSD